MIYTHWDNEPNNLVAEFGTQRDALALVPRGIERNGPHDTNTLSLDAEDETGQVTTVAYGEKLAVLARHVFATARVTS
ncbi:MAG: hypothetical protein ACR2GI_00990 [Thermomicrobiales bacterium]